MDRTLRERHLTPARLLEMSVSDMTEVLGFTADQADRVSRLLARGGPLAIEFDRLASRGIWISALDDETYPHLMVNYIKMPRLPRFNEDWTPILGAMRAGDFFVTSGEILIPEFRVEGTGDKRTVTASIEWTYPLEFVEVVWGDGAATGRQVISATDRGAFGRSQFRIPVDAKGKKWVRFAAWDSAGNGAVSQPIHF